ncbi:hypothetical protein COCCADRAFT_21952 [Bipolaris zeicola 26-R-13]|uniref:Secreted protein n=1 Tax=Cochliobolus carbonum (strain 26-R-13) TaxID=930089 RepID=W6YT76_COCC2|nr:uncharacterized protein COCCADRAFT_21952 [Bipolaris zeicola 26-R-13]EUC38624.1 hypothetical protein COCCADRAFT_21952 [Bipolaris zeicola 26-R-13]
MHRACGLVFGLPVSAALLGRQKWSGVVQAWSSDVSVIDGVCTADAEHGHCAGMQRAIDSPSPTKQRSAAQRTWAGAAWHRQIDAPWGLGSVTKLLDSGRRRRLGGVALVQPAGAYPKRGGFGDWLHLKPTPPCSTHVVTVSDAQNRRLPHDDG